MIVDYHIVLVNYKLLLFSLRARAPRRSRIPILVRTLYFRQAARHIVFHA